MSRMAVSQSEGGLGNLNVSSGHLSMKNQHPRTPLGCGTPAFHGCGSPWFPRSREIAHSPATIHFLVRYRFEKNRTHKRSIGGSSGYHSPFVTHGRVESSEQDTIDGVSNRGDQEHYGDHQIDVFIVPANHQELAEP